MCEKYSRRGSDLKMPGTGIKRGSPSLKPVSTIPSHGFALIAKWVTIPRLTLLMITAAAGATIAADVGRERIIIVIGGGCATPAPIEGIRKSTRTRRETKLAAHRCQDTKVSAPSAVKGVHGIRMIMYSGTPQSRFQQLWTKERRPLPGLRVGIGVSVAERKLKNPSGKGKPSRKSTSRGRFRRAIRRRLARQL